jgi:hypothetical protein
LVIDDSYSTPQYQAHLHDQIGRLLTTLETGQRDPTHGGPFAAARSIHVGIVSANMALGPLTGVGGQCGPGDDGVLFSGSPQLTAGCAADYSAMFPHGVFAWSATAASAAFATDVACVEPLGIGGCAFAFDLESALKALAPAPAADGTSSVAWTAPGYVPPTFWSGTGHGADPATNAGFLREDSVLAIVFLTDDDDSSTENWELFGNTAPYNMISIDIRQLVFPGELFPIERYVDGLIGLRRAPSRLVVSAIVGLPLDLSPPPGTPTTTALLDQLVNDPRMTTTINPTNDREAFVCADTVSMQLAQPALRIIQTAQGLAHRGARVGVHSICQADFGAAIDELLQNIALAMH